MTTETKTINGYKVTFIDFGFGDKRLYIENPEGHQFYEHKTSGLNYLAAAEREIKEDQEFRARLDKAQSGETTIEVQQIAVEGESIERHYELDAEFTGRVVIPAEINDGVHRTNDGRRIEIAELTDDHLLNILPSVHAFGRRRFQYIREALHRGFRSQVKATGMYSEAYEREVFA